MLRARKLASAALTAGLIAAGGLGATVLSASAAHAAACPTASQIVTGINAAATATANLESRLSPLSTSSRGSDVQLAARSTTDALNALTNDYNTQASALNGCPALSTSGAQSVAQAFDNLANVNLAMLATLTGKHAIFAQFTVTAPINASLRSLEAGFDADALALLGVAPSQQDAISADYNNITNGLDNTINTYNQVCIPSPLYPIILPVCTSA